MTNSKTDNIKRRNKLSRIIYFFPFQLLILHFKRNHFILIFWLLLFTYVTGLIGKDFGVVSLFLAPEYNGDINFYSFAIMGFALGGFIMAFHIYSYIMFSSEFLFLASLARPFLKFCMNNMLIPISFFVLLIYNSYEFLKNEQLLSEIEILINIIALIFGSLLFYFISVIYFIKFNKNVFAISGKSQDYFDELRSKKMKESYFIKKQEISKKIKKNLNWRVDTYMAGLFKIKLARNVDHYDRRLLDKVFTQNHINASVFEISIIITFIVLSIYREYEIFNIPAAASILLLFTFFVLIFSAFYSWFRGWTLTIIVILIIAFNFVSNRYNIMRFHNYAYGIDYNEKADYSYSGLKSLVSDERSNNKDYQLALKMLENWKSKNTVVSDLPNESKPKMLFINLSGGGLRAALWSIHVLNHLDSITDNKVFNQTQLITGASGGMIGAAYYREIFLKKLRDPSYYLSSQQMKNNISKDLLNQLAFSIATTDMMIRFQMYHDGDYSYTKDRGWFFEKRLVNNLSVFHESRLIDYYIPEFKSDIPMMIFSPAIVNDGRRLLISSQPISYLTYNDSTDYTSTYPSIEDIEFNKLFKRNNSLNIKMTSVLRMNSTFPYILPMVSLPTSPPIEVMDAGIRDNYGLKTSIQFVQEFKSWIAKNTDGILLIQIRDKQKYFEVENPNSGSLITRLFSPLTTVYGNMFKTHDYQNDEMLNSMTDWFEGKIDVVTFYMDQSDDEQISMSWHLTPKDKIKVNNSFFSKDNQAALNKIKMLLNK